MQARYERIFKTAESSLSVGCLYTLLFIALLSTLACKALAQADTLLYNAKIVQSDGSFVEALAIQNGKISAMGDSQDILALATTQTLTLDLQGKTVIPGLIDSHIHAIRAGLTYQREVSWIDTRSIPEALSRLESAALKAPRNTWLIVAGGWVEAQFKEHRRPTQAEIDGVAHGHPVYVQLLYSAVLLSSNAAQAWGLTPVAKKQNKNSNGAQTRLPSELLSRLTVQASESAETSGWYEGSSRTISELFDRLPQPSFKVQVIGTRAFFTELNRLGLTGVNDPGGYNLPLKSYRGVKLLGKTAQLTLKVRYNISAPRRGYELVDFQGIVKTFAKDDTPPFLQFNGLGENVSWSMYNNDAPTQEDQDQLFTVLLWAARQHLNVTLHWNNESSVDKLLDVLKRVNAIADITPCRWSIAHLNDASVSTLVAMKSLQIGWLVQNSLYYQAERFALQRGNPSLLEVSRFNTAKQLGLRTAAGTDAHRVMSFNPFVALQWLVSGLSISGTTTGSPLERPSRLQALQMYTRESAWMSFEDQTRGSIAPGFWADLVVLDRDYFSVPTQEIGDITSLMTFVNGKVVYPANAKVLASIPTHSTQASAQQQPSTFCPSKKFGPRGFCVGIFEPNGQFCAIQ